MAIDARIESVKCTYNGELFLKLIDRPKPPWNQSAGIAGQNSLTCLGDCNFNYYRLVGCDIWGGSESIMLGEVEIAKRIGYSMLKLNPNIEEAIDAYYASGPVPRYPVRPKDASTSTPPLESKY